MHEERDEDEDNSVAASAAFTDASSHHHVTDTDAASSEQSIHETTLDEELERGNRNKKTGNEGGYEGLDPREVEEARLRAQQPSVYAGLHGDKLEDMYSVPKKKKR